MKVKITKPAQRRLERIDDYHKKSGNKRKGRKLRKAIAEKSKLLSQYPELGAIEENLAELEQGHRSVIVEKFYKIVYLIAAPFIFIVDFFDTRQNPNKMKP